MITSCSRFVALSLTVIVVGVSGCSALHRGSGQPVVRTEQAGRPTDPASGTAEPTPLPPVTPDEATVAAIEEFLERTREYATPEEASGARLATRDVTPGALPTVDDPTTSVLPAQRSAGSTVTLAAAPPTVLPWQRPASQGNSAHPNTLASPRAVSTSAPMTGARFPGAPVVERLNRGQTAMPSTPVQRLAQPAPALPVLQSLFIRPGHKAGTAVAPSSGVSNVAVDVLETPKKVSWAALIDELENDTNGEKNIDSTWQLGMARLATHRGTPPALPADGLLTDSRLMFDALFAAASSVRDLVMDPVATGEHTLRLVEALRERVADRSDPVVANVKLCRRVSTYGVYEAMGPVDIVAGRATQTIVYSEIDNLHARQLDDGPYETRLATRVQVLTSEGESVWEHREPEIVDRCRRHRRDFFLAQRVTFPATLPAGSYALKVMVEDLESGRADEAIEPFVISSELSLAKNSGG